MCSSNNPTLTCEFRRRKPSESLRSSVCWPTISCVSTLGYRKASSRTIALRGSLSNTCPPEMVNRRRSRRAISLKSGTLTARSPSRYSFTVALELVEPDEPSSTSSGSLHQEESNIALEPLAAEAIPALPGLTANTMSHHRIGWFFHGHETGEAFGATCKHTQKGGSVLVLRHHQRRSPEVAKKLERHWYRG